MKNYLKIFGHLLLLGAAVVTGAADGVLMAAAAGLDGGAGATATAGEPYGEASVELGSGSGQYKQTRDAKGISNTLASEQASPELYEPDVDKVITKIRPKATPLANIMRYAKTVNIKGMEYEHFSLATRPIITTSKSEIAAGVKGVQPLTVNGQMFDADDTIWVKGVKGYDANGETSKHDLILHVVDAQGENLKVYPVNGKPDAVYGTNDGFPDAKIPTNTTLIRLGKACTELDSQTTAFANVPTPQKVYCQIFMAQVEQSTIEAMRTPRADWEFSDLEEDSIFDMRRGQEGSLWFGHGAKRRHALKRNEHVWFCEGIWYQADKDLEIGSLVDGKLQITEGDLVDFNRALFTGDGSGSDQKVLFAGSDLMAALEKVKSDKKALVTSDTVEVWNLRFKSMDSNFGEVLAIYHPGFDEYGMADKGFVLDPEMLTRVQALSFSRNVIDFDKLGVRNSTAVVLREAIALVLRNKSAHARVALKTA